MFDKEIELDKYISLSHSSVPLFLLMISKKKKVAYFSDNYQSSLKLKSQIKNIEPNMNVILFPEFDCSFFSNVSPTKDVLHQRMKSLNLLTKVNNKVIFICPLNSLLLNTMKKDLFLNKKLDFFNNSKNIYSGILDFLSKNSYERVEIVSSKGEYCVRGEVIDFFSPINENPVRVLFNFEDVESIYTFDSNNQKTIKEMDHYSILPASEIIFNYESIKIFRENFRRFNIMGKDEFYKSISNNVIIPGSDQFLPILYKEYDSIINYLDDFYFFFNDNYQDEIKISLKKNSQELTYVNESLFNESQFYAKDNLIKILQKKKIHLFTKINRTKDHITFSEQLDFYSDKKKNISNFKKIINCKNVNKVIFCYNSKSSKMKFISLLNQNSIVYKTTNNIFDIYKIQNKYLLLNFEIDSSFKVKILEGYEVFFFSDADLFEKITKRKIGKSSNNDNLINEFSQLNLGDYIVHSDHGIGKFNGLKKKFIGDTEFEFIELLYYNDDKLYIPIENLELISRYGFSTNKVNLDKLGLQNWQLRKASLKKKIKEIASELINTAAKRELTKSVKISPNFIEYEKFSSKFEFTETSDQVKAIENIELDFESGKPMDRLICGDVGFGKTEIAMRASLLIMSAGFQVAMVCPKVLLVNQHLMNFQKRFEGFGYQISKISRFENVTKKNEIKKQLNYGEIDLIIGTHAILAIGIKFKKLGLIIIDEEQSFGVEQKEQLKKNQPNVHILTMSATPIPRTLQSSLFKLRDISLIKTPPVNRLNIKTFLMIFDDGNLKKIIETELSRNGQIFYVTPRIQDIEEIEKKLKKIMPSLRYSVIHSRLNNTEIEKVYNNFFNKKIDLLLSTAMIESGLDISNVNTILINKPYMFGLSQLYQLRGRVGRSSIQAYAYLLLDKKIKLNESKLHRLRLISKINKLGAGFSIAANDLDLRGAGNIIGSEQSGHIKEVGIELYYKMLQDAVSEIKDEKTNITEWSPTINLGVSFNIPETYIGNLDIRMQIYKKISEVDDLVDLKGIIEDLNDRFGKVPGLFQNLFKIIEIKIICKMLNIKRIDRCPDGFVLELNNNSQYIDKILKLANINSTKIKLLPKSKLMYKTKSYDKVGKINELKSFIESIK